MRELNVTLDFACCCCSHDVGVTLKCEGQGLATGARVIASVNVPCPNCGTINQLAFNPTGTVHTVAPYHGPRQLPEPSLS
jgi:hypothetical protein